MNMTQPSKEAPRKSFWRASTLVQLGYLNLSVGLIIAAAKRIDLALVLVVFAPVSAFMIAAGTFGHLKARLVDNIAARFFVPLVLLVSSVALVVVEFIWSIWSLWMIAAITCHYAITLAWIAIIHKEG